MRPGAKYLLPPIAYLMLVKGMNKYYFNNDLRHLYKQDILVPWLKRIDDHQCSDPRDIAIELAACDKVDPSKSIVLQQMELIRSQGQSASQPL